MTETGLEFRILVIVICLIFVIWNFYFSNTPVLQPRSWFFVAQEGERDHFPLPLSLQSMVCLHDAYSSRTFFIRTEAVGWSLKFITLFLIGQITVE